MTQVPLELQDFRRVTAGAHERARRYLHCWCGAKPGEACRGKPRRDGSPRLRRTVHEFRFRTALAWRPKASTV